LLRKREGNRYRF